MKDVTAILTSDWHLREDTPVSRTDDFWEAQWNKVQQISELQDKFACPVIHAGDLFHHWKPSPWLLWNAIMNLPDQFYTVYGQHDLPQHSLDLKNKSGIAVLYAAGKIEQVLHGSWGEDLKSSLLFPGQDMTMAVWHKFVWDGRKVPWPGCDEITAEEILEESNFDIVVTGDHHRPFVYEKYGRKVVNPGCLTRQFADYADHQPRVYLWNAETNTVGPHFLDVADGVVSREHIEKQQARDNRLEAFISRLDTDWEVSVSFEENLRRFLGTNHQRKAVHELIYKAIES